MITRIIAGVVVEDDDLEQASGSVGADDEGPPVAGDESIGLRTAWVMSSSGTPCLRKLSAIST